VAGAEDLTAWRAATTPPGGLVFPRPDGSPWRRDDWANWRDRTFQANAEKIGRLHARPYDLRHSFVSLLIAEGRTVIDVAGQAGHSPETCLRNCAHPVRGVRSRRAAQRGGGDPRGPPGRRWTLTGCGWR
jgi:integrase